VDISTNLLVVIFVSLTPHVSLITVYSVTSHLSSSTRFPGSSDSSAQHNFSLQRNKIKIVLFSFHSAPCVYVTPLTSDCIEVHEINLVTGKLFNFYAM